jgi:hypothetical protein
MRYICTTRERKKKKEKLSVFVSRGKQERGKEKKCLRIAG